MRGGGLGVESWIMDARFALRSVRIRGPPGERRNADRGLSQGLDESPLTWSSSFASPTPLAFMAVTS